MDFRPRLGPPFYPEALDTILGGAWQDAKARGIPALVDRAACAWRCILVHCVFSGGYTDDDHHFESGAHFVGGEVTYIGFDGRSINVVSNHAPGDINDPDVLGFGRNVDVVYYAVLPTPDRAVQQSIYKQFDCLGRAESALVGRPSFDGGELYYLVVMTPGRRCELVSVNGRPTGTPPAPEKAGSQEALIYEKLRAFKGLCDTASTIFGGRAESGDQPSEGGKSSLHGLGESDPR
jgi:hypothetical protein